MINKNKISEVLVRNEKVKWNFWVIDIIENNILNEGFKNDLSRYRSLLGYDQLSIACIML